MDNNSWVLAEYHNLVLFGILLNFISTIGFGIYKSFNLNQEQILNLMDQYPVKSNTVRMLAMWLIPFLGYFTVLRDILLVQRYFKHGKNVYDFIEDKLKKEYARQSSR
jgi:hypothetical protein